MITINVLRTNLLFTLITRYSLYIKKVMEDLKEEIRKYGTFELLTKEIERITFRKKEEEASIQQQEELRKTVAELQKIIADEKIANEEKKKSILYELSEEQVSPSCF